MPIDTVTEIDSAWLDLNSIQVCFEKVFTLAQTRLDRSQFAFGIFWAFRHVQIAFDLHRTDLFIFRFVFLCLYIIINEKELLLECLQLRKRSRIA